MTALKERMIEDLQLHGFAEKTQEAYLRSVRQLSAYCRYLAESCENVRGWRMLSVRRLRDKAIQIVSNFGVRQIEY
jgi:hypothetical protein